MPRSFKVGIFNLVSAYFCLLQLTPINSVFAEGAGPTASATSHISVVIPYNLKRNLSVGPEGSQNISLESNFPGTYIVEVRNLKNQYQSASLLTSSESLKNFRLPNQGIVILMPQ